MEDVLPCVLKHMPLPQRLRCALVCRAWAEVAVKVPAVVICGIKSSDHSEQLQHWLGKHGGVVEAMHCSSGTSGATSELQLHVPKFTQLRSLQLYDVKAQLPAQEMSDCATVLPQLQKLGLRFCNLTVQLASQLLSATTLTSLQWERVNLHKRDWTEELQPQEGAAILLQQLQLLPSLASLQLACSDMTAADIAPLSNLHNLQRLTLDSPTKGSPTDVRALLAALQHLTQLQHLELRECQLHRAEALPGPQHEVHQCFSALTASTQLTALVLANRKYNVLPQAAFKHMFPAGRMLEELKALCLDSDRQMSHFCVEAAQVAVIATSCPQLQQLRLVGVTGKGFDTGCLLQLPPGVTRVEGLDWVRPAP